MAVSDIPHLRANSVADDPRLINFSMYVFNA
jgi:hypothetical protein